MSLTTQKPGLQKCFAEISQFIAESRPLVKKFQKMLQKLLMNFSTTSKTLMNLQTSQTWMKRHVTLLFLIPQPLKKRSTEGQSQGHKCRSSSFHCSFNSRSKKNRKYVFCFSPPSTTDM